METSGQGLPPTAGGGASVHLAREGFPCPNSHFPSSSKLGSGGKAASRTLPLHFQASASRKVYKCAQPPFGFRNVKPALPFLIPQTLQQEKSPKEHPFLSWTLTLGPVPDPENIGTWISQADLTDSRTTINSQWQPALQTAGPRTSPQGSLSQSPGGPHSHPHPKVPAFPSKGPHQGGPENSSNQFPSGRRGAFSLRWTGG